MNVSIRQGDWFHATWHRSLWEMINANLIGLVPLVYQLGLYEHVSSGNYSESKNSFVDKETNEQVTKWLTIAESLCEDFDLNSAKGRIVHFNKELIGKITWVELGIQCKVLREAITDGLKGQLIYKYRDDKAKVFSNWKDDWKTVLAKFPSTTEDVKAAIDCWALGYATASIFHSIRILEYGMAALAKNVGRNVGTQTWQILINEIESSIRDLGKSLPGGVIKSDRLRFLSEAAKEMVYFKDGWRNQVSHNRATYDEHQARSMLEHVRSFMTVLSTQLSEEPLP